MTMLPTLNEAVLRRVPSAAPATLRRQQRKSRAATNKGVNKTIQSARKQKRKSTQHATSIIRKADDTGLSREERQRRRSEGTKKLSMARKAARDRVHTAKKKQVRGARQRTQRMTDLKRMRSAEGKGAANRTVRVPAHSVGGHTRSTYSECVLPLVEVDTDPFEVPSRYKSRETKAADKATKSGWQYLQRVTVSPHAQLAAAQAAIATLSPRILGPAIVKRLARADIKKRVRNQFEQEIISQSRYYASVSGSTQEEFIQRVPDILKRRMRDARVKRLIALKVEEAVARGLYQKKGRELERELRSLSHFILGVAQIGKILKDVRGDVQTPPPKNYKTVNKRHTTVYNSEAAQRANDVETRVAGVIDTLPRTLAGEDSPAVRSYGAIRNAIDKAKDDLQAALKVVAGDPISRRALIVPEVTFKGEPLHIKVNPNYGGVMPEPVKRVAKAQQNLRRVKKLAAGIIHIKDTYADDQGELEDKLQSFYSGLDDELQGIFGMSAASMSRRSTVSGARLHKEIMGTTKSDGIWHLLSRADESGYLASRITELYDKLRELKAKRRYSESLGRIGQELDKLDYERQQLINKINVAAGKDPKRPDFYIGTAPTLKSVSVQTDDEGRPHYVTTNKRDIYLSSYHAGGNKTGKPIGKGVKGSLEDMEQKVWELEQGLAGDAAVGGHTRSMHKSIINHMNNHGITDEIKRMYDASVSQFFLRGGKADFVSRLMRASGIEGGNVTSRDASLLFQIDKTVIQNATSPDYSDANRAYLANVYDAITAKEHLRKSADPKDVEKQVLKQAEQIMQKRADEKKRKLEKTTRVKKGPSMGTPEAQRAIKLSKQRDIFGFNRGEMSRTKVKFSKDRAKTVNGKLIELYGISPGKVAMINGEQWTVTASQRHGGVYAFKRGPAWLLPWKVDLDSVEVGKVIIQSDVDYVGQLLRAGNLKQAEALAKAMKDVPLRKGARASEYIELGQTQAFAEGSPHKILYNTYTLLLRDPQFYRDIASGGYNTDMIEKLIRATIRKDYPEKLGGEQGTAILLAYMHRVAESGKVPPELSTRDRIATLMAPIITPEADDDVQQSIVAEVRQRSPFESTWGNVKGVVSDGRVLVVYQDKKTRMYRVDLITNERKATLSGTTAAQMVEPRFIKLPAVYVKNIKDIAQRVRSVQTPDGYQSRRDAMSKLSDAVGKTVTFKQSTEGSASMFSRGDVSELTLSIKPGENPVDFVRRSDKPGSDLVLVHSIDSVADQGRPTTIYGYWPALISDNAVEVFSQFRRDNINRKFLAITQMPINLTTKQIELMRTKLHMNSFSAAMKGLAEMMNDTVQQSQDKVVKMAKETIRDELAAGMSFGEAVESHEIKKLYEYGGVHLAPHERKSTMDYVWDILEMPELGLDIGHRAGVDYAIRRVYENVYAELQGKYRHRVGELARELKVSGRVAELMLADEIKRKMRTDPVLVSKIKARVQQASNPKVAGAAIGYFIGHVTRTVLDRAILGPQEAIEEGAASKFGRATIGAVKSTLYGAFFTMAMITVQRLLNTSLNSLGDQERSNVVRGVANELSQDAPVTRSEASLLQAQMSHTMRNPAVRKRVGDRVRQYTKKPIHARSSQDRAALSRDIAAHVHPSQYFEGLIDQMFPKQKVPRTSTRGYERHTVTDPTGTGLILGGLLKYTIARTAAEAVVLVAARHIRSSYAKKLVAQQMEHQILTQLQRSGVPVTRMTEKQMENVRNAIVHQMKKPRAVAHLKWLEDRIRKDPNFLRKKGEINWWIRRAADFLAIPLILGQLRSEWKNPIFQQERQRSKDLAKAARAQKNPTGMGPLDLTQIATRFE